MNESVDIYEKDLSINLSKEEYFFLYAPGNNFCSSEVSFLQSMVSIQKSSFYLKENPDVPDGNQSAQEVYSCVKERENLIEQLE